MPRMARLVVPGLPHHVTQRGVRKQQTFFCDKDYKAYLALLRDSRVNAEVDIWAYCLMPNHIHIIAVPKNLDGLARLFRRVHGDYARRINASHEWSGHLWQQRFYSTVMDEAHAIAALRYVEQNPVRAGLCNHPKAWRWSSARAHLNLVDSEIVDIANTRNFVSNWDEFLNSDAERGDIDLIRKHTKTGRPTGSDDFVDMLEVATGRRLHHRRPGPRPS